ncbi:hypothetical protein [Allokutzneria oryzae]|uniref:Uncharacterized protein n=1 Tax=Allokutzneria oryzae TaxID=1378989 RepID=A0ABV6ABB3_9PSEU
MPNNNDTNTDVEDLEALAKSVGYLKFVATCCFCGHPVPAGQVAHRGCG